MQNAESPKIVYNVIRSFFVSFNKDIHQESYQRPEY